MLRIVPEKRVVIPFISRFLFPLLLAAYASIIVAGADLGPGDEFVFLPTLQSGKFYPIYNQDFPYFDPYEIGRFVPLGGQEYNLVALLTSQPWAYFAMNAFEFVAFASLLLAILRALPVKSLTAHLSVLLLFLMPGVTLTFFKLLYVEKNVAFLLAVLFASHLTYGRQPRPLWLVLALISANLAMYYKETVFALVAVFAATHLLLSWKTIKYRMKLLDVLLLASAAAYVGVYLTYVFPHRGITLYNYSAYDPLLVFTKNLLNYSLFSDPIPMLLAPLAVMRLYQVFVQKREPHPFLDSLIAAGVTFIAAYLVLNIYTPYYLLPCYLCALPPLLYFYEKEYLKSLFWKSSFAVVAALLVGNTIPSGIHYLTYNKYLPANFNSTIDYLVSEVNRQYDGQRINIFLDGVDRGTGQGTYLVFGEFLKYKGLSFLKFDLRTDTEAVDKRLFVWKQSPFDMESDLDVLGVPPEYPRHPFTVFQRGPLQTVSRGDYLVVTPQTSKFVNAAYLQSLMRDYDLVYQTESGYAVPNISLKTAIKFVIMKLSVSSQINAGFIVSQNLMNWPDYYVFVRR